ncbi:MAG TPA: SpoIIE family protein phosphatase [Thermoanaerobaculia bacterium]|nr:SpoIIE family protein phosphatase [Thermoanaerobaculia bacterium]
MLPPFKLVPRGAARLTGEIRPADGPLRIGRDPQCKVVIADLSVSRHHARLQWEGPELILEDLGSSRGTHVNGAPVRRCSLKPGDVVRFGQSAEYAVEGEMLSTLQKGAQQSGAEGEVRRLQLLLDVARSLNTATVLDEVLDSVLQAALRLMHADRAFLCLVQEGGQETRLTCPRSADPAAPPSAALLEQALREGKTVVGDEAAATPLRVAYRPFVAQASFIGRVEVIGGLLIERSRNRRGFTPDDLAVFESLAADAATAIDSARLYREAREKAKMDHEMSLARTIQTRLLRPPPEVPFAEVHAFNRPALSVGGDLYHAALRADGALALALGDIAGKGMSAALLMAMIQGLLELLHDLGQPLSGLLPLLDGQLRRHNPGNRFLTFAVAFLYADGTVEISNAGHCPVVLLRRDGGIELVQPHGPILGVLPRTGWGSERLALRPGDALAFYSDGILESMDPEGNELGLEGIEAALRPLAGNAPAEIAEGLLRAAESHRRGGEAQDDVTLLVARYRSV